MFNVLESSIELVIDLFDLAASLGVVLLPWLGLIFWLVFWLFAVNWTKLRPMIVEQGGWLGLLLIGFVWILIWGVVAPPASGSYRLFNLTLSNFVGKTVYVTTLYCLMLLAGGAQLSGMCEGWLFFPAESPDDSGHHSHGHASHDHDSHGHDSHGHDSHTGQSGGHGTQAVHATESHGGHH